MKKVYKCAICSKVMGKWFSVLEHYEKTSHNRIVKTHGKKVYDIHIKPIGSWCYPMVKV